jgi:hypothetical protein
MHRWIARLLVLVITAPAFGPLAMAYAMQAQAAHCLRQPAKPVMQCHHGMAMVPEPPSSEASFRAAEQCCQNHDCCRSLGAPRWAQAQSKVLSLQGLPIQRALSAPDAQLTSSTPAENDSARAPPRR